MIRLEKEQNATFARELFDSLMGGKCRHTAHANAAEFTWVCDAVWSRTGTHRSVTFAWLRQRQTAPDHTGWNCPKA